MIVYLFAGLALLLAVVFAIKYFVDKHKISSGGTKTTKPDSNGVTIVVEEDKKKDVDEKLLKRPKRDLVLTIVFMALCEILILLGNYVIEI